MCWETTGVLNCIMEKYFSWVILTLSALILTLTASILTLIRSTLTFLDLWKLTLTKHPSNLESIIHSLEYL